MNPERYARAKEIFLTASALPAGRRAAYLDGACEGDADLRAEVESLLAHRDNPAGVLRTGALAAVAASAFGSPARESASRAILPERIGPCRILGILGEGGMGIVYRAEQTEPVRREVALKLIRGGVSSSMVLARFEAERQSLAMMDHPNIARLFDAGATEDGRPYFLMELIRGVPLTEYARSKNLAVRDRLDLFHKVCGAVRHAHQRGVIHRDLKPSNILVTETEGAAEPKVIDFSIAKAIEEPMMGTEFRTREGQLVGTLEYMAPEQAMGRIDKVDTRTDVYALGVILHELLSDALPIDIKGLPLHEAIRKIAEEPVRSLGGTRSRTTMGAATRVDSDLATIAGKCLEKDPERRYGSAAELADDVERYVSSRPIAARPPSTVYQLRKLVGRHRFAAGFLVTVFVLLSIFAAITRVQLGEQRRARAAAETAARKAERVSAFHESVLEAADPAKAGGRVSIREALDRAAASVDRGLSEDPDVVVEIHRIIGKGYASVGLWKEALQHFMKGLSVRRAIIGGASAPDLPTARLLVAITDPANNLGRYPLAFRSARLAASMGFALEGADSPLAAEALAESGWAARSCGKSEESLRDSAASLEIRRRLHPAHDPNLTHSLYLYGMLREDDDGEKSLREAVEILKRTEGEEGSEYLLALSALSGNLAARGRTSLDEQIALCRQLVQGFGRIHGEDSTNYALAANNLGTVLMIRPDGLDEAERQYQRAYSIWSRAGGAAPSALAALQNLAYARACRGNYAESAEGYREVLARERDAGREEDGLSWVHSANLGVSEHLMGDDARGEIDLRHGLQIQWKVDGPDASPTAIAEGWLGCLLVETRRPMEAEKHIRHAMRVALQRGDPANTQDFLSNTLGRALAAQGHRAEAEAEIAKSRAFLLDRMETPRELRHALEQTAKLFDAWGQREDKAACRAALKRLNDATRGSGAIASK